MVRIRRKLFIVGGAILVAMTGTATPAFAAATPGVVAGHLTDGNTPIENAYVTLVDADYNYIASDQTDPSGGYQLLDVPEGTYKLHFSLQGGFEQWSVQKSNFDAADPITVAAGATTTVNETIRPHGGMTGRVFNPDGSPAAQVDVSVSKDGPDYGSAYAYTDTTGLYVIPYLSPGNYRVSFRRDFLSPEQYAHNAMGYHDAALIPVTAGAVTTLDQTLVALGTITGTVTRDGLPADGIQVEADNPTGYGHGSTTTGPDGTYRIRLWPGSYNVTFRLPDGPTQYAPRKLNPADAGVYTVIPNIDTILDEKIRPTGTVGGQLTDSTAAPVAHASVDLVGPWATLSTSIDENGAYRLTAFPGTYQLEFHTEHGSQWSHGQSTADTADPISVVADTNLAVDEELATPGTLVVTAQDSATHEPVTDFCVSMSTDLCTSTGSVTIEGLLPGRHVVRHSFQEDNPYIGTNLTVVVSSGQTTSSTLSLTRKASVTTVITDAATGAPVAHACLDLVNITAPMWLGISTGHCSDENGNVTVPRLIPGSYKPFVWIHDGVHGLQWVGPNGGVGKFTEATTVTVGAGQSFALPTVRLDQAGTITGTVRDEASGEPIPDAAVGLSTFNFGYGHSAGTVTTDTNGRYTQSGLGPYSWTLYFSDWAHAAEWSGDSAERGSAAGIMVEVGASTSYDTALGHGTLFTGKVFGHNGSTATAARVTVINADSGDEIGAGDIYGGIIRYTVRVKGPQRIKLRYEGSVLAQRYDGWVGGADFSSATVFPVPLAGTEKINVTMTQTEP